MLDERQIDQVQVHVLLTYLGPVDGLSRTWESSKKFVGIQTWDAEVWAVPVLITVDEMGCKCSKVLRLVGGVSMVKK